MREKPQPGLHVLPIPDKYSQLYFDIKREGKKWVAVGDQGKSYDLRYNPKNPSQEFLPYLQLIKVPEEDLQKRLSFVSSEATRLATQKSFLEGLAQGQPKCTRNYTVHSEGDLRLTEESYKSEPSAQILERIQKKFRSAQASGPKKKN